MQMTYDEHAVSLSVWKYNNNKRASQLFCWLAEANSILIHQRKTGPSKRWWKQTATFIYLTAAKDTVICPYYKSMDDKLDVQKGLT